MAALPAGVQYGLSSEASHRGGKDLVFVKLTDSALRTIEQFIRNTGRMDSTPTIQFLPGDIGKISIPSAAGSGAGGPAGQPVTFRFSLSNNAEMEGPQGSLECLQTSGGRQLCNLGALSTRMRVLANDDVYEATKQRMTVDAENLKSKCTREIKPNQTDIGRKVKVKQHQGPGGQRVPPSRAPPAPHPAPPAPAPFPPAPAPAPARSDTHHWAQHSSSMGAGSLPAGHAPSHAAQPRPPTHPKLPPHHNPDLLKRPIKERLIQLLALRPYKKPELYSRINSEGIKDKERGIITTILQQISALKDNCYQLHRHLWNDVDENWRFYSEEEKQQLKRRKPQNLTPPLSSDSGHSPSPPPAGHKRVVPSPTPPAAVVQAGSASNPAPAGQPPPKKQRISHYSRPPSHYDNTREGSGSPAALSNGYHSSTSMSSGERKSYSDEDTPPPTTHSSGKRENGYSVNFRTAQNFLDTPPKHTNYETSPVPHHMSPVKGGMRCGATSPEQLQLQEERQEREQDKSPDSTTLAGTHSPPPDPTQDFPDYVAEYGEITSLEQRRRYKAEFAAKYKEYRVLHERVEAVRRVFTRLEQRLHGEQGGAGQREIRRQIVTEYQRTQQDASYQRDMAHFKYLHHKLAHIKQLVHEYDSLPPPHLPHPPAHPAPRAAPLPTPAFH